MGKKYTNGGYKGARTVPILRNYFGVNKALQVIIHTGGCTPLKFSHMAEKSSLLNEQKKYTDKSCLTR